MNLMEVYVYHNEHLGQLQRQATELTHVGNHDLVIGRLEGLLERTSVEASLNHITPEEATAIRKQIFDFDPQLEFLYPRGNIQA